MRLQNPWPNGFSINARGGYGWRIHPKTGKRSFHTGIDIGGTFPVTAAGDGVVVRVAPNWHTLSPKDKQRQSSGNMVLIDHGFVHTAYFHGARQSELKVGQRVKAGDFIFQSGTTGSSTGNHLHFEVRKGALQATHTDPIPYINGTVTPPFNPGGSMDKATWMKFQSFLKARYGYKGRIDGAPGNLTYQAMQRLARENGYVGPIDGKVGPMTMRAIQSWLGVAQTGKWDSITVSALQNRLNG